LIMVCDSGVRSKRAQAVAQKLGYEKVHSLQGGLKAWKEANLPVSKA
jgi:rhodanese-related sulfurtransferase